MREMEEYEDDSSHHYPSHVADDDEEVVLHTSPEIEHDSSANKNRTPGCSFGSCFAIAGACNGGFLSSDTKSGKSYDQYLYGNVDWYPNSPNLDQGERFFLLQKHPE